MEWMDHVEEAPRTTATSADAGWRSAAAADRCVLRLRASAAAGAATPQPSGLRAMLVS